MDNEGRLLSCYRAMDQKGQRALLNLARVMSKTPCFMQGAKNQGSTDAYMEIIKQYEDVLEGEIPDHCE